MVDYLMVFALFLLLVALALPTIIHLSAILREDESKHRAAHTTAAHATKDTSPLFVGVPASAPLTPLI